MKNRTSNARRIAAVATLALAIVLTISHAAAGTHRRLPRASGDVGEIIRKVKSTYASTRTADIRFEQSGTGGTSTGVLAYAPGDHYRLELKSQTIISDGARVITYTPARKQVVISRATKTAGRLTPEDILTSFPGDYQCALTGEVSVNGRDCWIVRCTPGTGKKIGDVTQATLYIDKATFRFQQVAVESPTLGSVKVRILAATYGKAIPDGRFMFAINKDMRVVDLTQ